MAPPPAAVTGSSKSLNHEKPTPRLPPIPKRKPKPPPSVYFSLASYSRTLVDHLRSLSIPILPGLADREISAIEASLGFSFPPDLRSILQVGLPGGPRFPDWRTESVHQLRVLFDRPIVNLLENISQNGLWVDSWGPRPEKDDAVIALVKKLVADAPTLVPVYGSCYIASTSSNLAGNPVFSVRCDGVRVLSFDVAGLFQRFGVFLAAGFDDVSFDDYVCNAFPEGREGPWAATKARGIPFWTEVAERGRIVAAPEVLQPWWRMVEDEALRACLDEASWRLIDGGWREEELREMMMCGGDGGGSTSRLLLAAGSEPTFEEARSCMRILSEVLLCAGWSIKDVAYSLDLDEDQEIKGGDYRRRPQWFAAEEEDGQGSRGTTTLMQLLSQEA